MGSKSKADAQAQMSQAKGPEQKTGPATRSSSKQPATTTCPPSNSSTPSTSSSSAGDASPVKLLTCTHKFHSQCIRDWLIIKLTCPVCRVPLEPEKPKTEVVVDQPERAQPNTPVPRPNQSTNGTEPQHSVLVTRDGN